MNLTKKMLTIIVALIASGTLAHGMQNEHKYDDNNNDSDYTQTNNHDDDNDTGIIDVDTDNLVREHNAYNPLSWNGLPNDVVQEVLRYLFALQADSPYQMEEHYKNAYREQARLKPVSKSFMAGIAEKDYTKKVHALTDIWSSFTCFNNLEYRPDTVKAFIATCNASILQLHADSQDRHHCITTPLHIAALMNDVHFFRAVHNECITMVCQHLRDNGEIADRKRIAVQLLHQEDRFRNKPIHYAEYRCGSPTYTYALSDYIANVPGYLLPGTSQTAQDAIEAFNPDDQFAPSTLITALARTDGNNNQSGLLQDLALHRAIAFNSLAATSILDHIQSQPVSEAWAAYLCAIDYCGDTVLHQAFIHNEPNTKQLITKLLAAAKDQGILASLLTSKNQAGNTALHIALYLRRNNTLVTELLVAAKNHGVLAELLISKNNDGNTLLHELYRGRSHEYSNTKNHYNLLKAVLAVAKDQNVLPTLLTSKNNREMTVLPMVVRYYHNRMVSELRNVAFNTNEGGKRVCYNDTPTDAYDMAMLSLNVEDNNNKTFIEALATSANEQEIRIALLDNQSYQDIAALLNHRNDSNEMLMELIIAAHDQGILDMLLNSKDNKGLTAIDHATYNSTRFEICLEDYDNYMSREH